MMAILVRVWPGNKQHICQTAPEADQITRDMPVLVLVPVAVAVAVVVAVAEAVEFTHEAPIPEPHPASVGQKDDRGQHRRKTGLLMIKFDKVRYETI
jgi:hypothetical protein